MSVAAILRGESLFCRVPLGMLRDLPRAARTVYEALHYLARRGSTFDVTDRELANECGIGRRCVQKGLRQLEDLGIIERFRTRGRRLITWLVKFASKTAANGAQKAPQAAPSGATTSTRPSPATSSPETARKILDQWKAVGWTLKLTGPGEMVVAKIRPDADPADLSEDLKRQAKIHRGAILNLLHGEQARE